MRGALSWGVSGSGLSGSHCARTSVSLPCRGHRIVCQAEGGHGNPKVQDTLVDLLQVQITQEKVKQLAAEEGQKLVQNAEELRAELDKLQQRSQSRSDAAFDGILADFNKKADELDDNLRQTRKEQEAKTKEFNEWERSMAIRRSQGLFFKSLHQLKNHQRASTPRDQQQAADKILRLRNLEQRQQQDLPLIILMYGGLSIVSGVAAVADATHEGGILWRGFLYGVLAVVFGFAYASKALL